MSRPDVPQTKLASVLTSRSILHELHPADHAKAITALKKVLDAVEDFGRVLHHASSKSLATGQEVRMRAIAIIRDAPVLAAYAYTSESRADRQGDRALAHAMGQIVGRARYLIHVAGGDRHLQAHYPQAADLPFEDATELSLQLLRMTPAEMKAFKDREVEARSTGESGRPAHMRANRQSAPLSR